jgi:hypothetical protein
VTRLLTALAIAIPLAIVLGLFGDIGISGGSIPAATALAGGQVELVDLAHVAADIERSTTVTLSAYSLSARGRVAKALVAAANRGGRMWLVLDGAGMAGAMRSNRATAAALCAATGGRNTSSRIDQDLATLCEGRLRIDMTRYALHMKAAVLEDAIYVSDRNWTSSRRSLILALPSAMRTIVERAILGAAGTSGSLTTRKADSLAAEATLLRSNRSRRVLLESESFGRSAIADALVARAGAGDDVTLVVARFEYGRSRTERALLSDMARHGVHVFTATSDEKIAVAGDSVWIGSANATAGVPNQIDWGFWTDDHALAMALTQHVEGDRNAGIAVR